MTKDFTRKELNAISSRAVELAKEQGSEFWKRVYERLADSAATLDAFIARTENK